MYICLSRFGMQTLNETSRHLGMQSFLSVLKPITISTIWLSANARACDGSVSRLGAALLLLIEIDTAEARVEQAHM